MYMTIRIAKRAQPGFFQTEKLTLNAHNVPLDITKKRPPPIRARNVKGTHTNQIQCQLCPGGKYTTLTAASHCLSCVAGGFSTDPTTPCTNCPAGYYQDNNGQAQCLPCVAGQYQNQNGQTLCYDCVAGQYQNIQAQISCEICPDGTYFEGTGALSCKTCPTGFTARHLELYVHTFYMSTRDIQSRRFHHRGCHLSNLSTRTIQHHTRCVSM